MHFFARNKLKTLLLILFLYVGVFSAHTFATETTSSDRENEEAVNIQTPGESCGDMSFFVAWSLFVKPEQKATYSITSNSILDQQANVEYELRQEDKLLETWTEHQFNYLFTTPWTYLLKTILRRSESCVQSVEQSITVANEIRLGVGLSEKDTSFLTQSIWSKWIWFVLLPAANDTLNDASTITRIQQIAQVLPSSDVLFVEESQARLLFAHLDDMRTYGIWLPDRIILVGNISTSALRRLLHQSPSITNFSEIAITPAPYLSSVVQQLINWNSLQQLDVVRVFHPQDTANRRWLPLSKITDYLLTHGMSINFLLFLLCTPLIALCLVILKQVVWFNVGGVYYLIFAAAANIFVWREISLLMFLAAFFWQFFSQIITKYLYLLYAPKVWLTITLTCISFMVLSIILPWWHYFSLPTDPLYVFFPLITFSLMMQYIYPNYNSFIKKDRRLWFVQFILWVVCITSLLQWSWLQQFILWYPDILLLVVGAIIYLGRFAWLQIGEYIRFWPLVTKYFEDEE